MQVPADGLVAFTAVSLSLSVMPRRRENGVGCLLTPVYLLGFEPVRQSGVEVLTLKGHALLLRARRSEFRSPTGTSWVEFERLIGESEWPEFDPKHPLGCHRRRILARVVLEHLIDALVHGPGYERIATVACSDRMIRRRLKKWAKDGVARRSTPPRCPQYDLIIRLELDDLAADGCITKAPAATKPDSPRWIGAGGPEALGGP